MIRLQKYIADCGITSRRKAEDYIVQGRVAVNGMTITELGTKVDPSSDAVEVDGHAIDLASVKKIYILMHKPRGYITTLDDPQGRKTILDLCQTVSERIYPVGRLDYLSEGLLLLTNDGDLGNLVMHPRNNVTKVYEVKVFGHISEVILKRLRKGVETEDGLMKPLSVRVIEQLHNKTWLEFRLGEGKNREIRKICEACGLTVDKLRRVSIENLTIQGIAPGKYREVSKSDILKGLGFNKNGERVSNISSNGFFSHKKSINLKKRIPTKGKPADDKSFLKFRKEHYYDSINAFKEIQSEEKAKRNQKPMKKGKRLELKELREQKVQNDKSNSDLTIS